MIYLPQRRRQEATAMKALKGLLLCIMVFLFFIVLVILQIDFVITHTALSGSYFRS